MDSEKLIELVSKNKILYDFNGKYYHDVKKKDIIWRNIADKLKVPEIECKKQWNTLRDSFRRNLKKRKLSYSQGSVPLKRWKFEEEMEFLLPYLKEKITTSSLTESGSPKDEPEETEVPTDTESLYEHTNEHLVTELNEVPDAGNFNSHLLIKSSKQFSNSNLDETASSLMMKYILDENSKREKQDEIETLFYSLAQTVKKLPPFYRAVAKAKVCSIVSEIEIKSLTDPVPTTQTLATMMPPSAITSTASEETTGIMATL